MKWLVLTAVALMIGGGCVDEATDPATGAELYAIHCASCHGDGGRGDGPVAASLSTAPADLTRIAERPGGFDEARLMRVIDGRLAVATHGPRDMPVWGAVFSGDPVGEPLAGPRSVLPTRALVDYLETLQASPAAAPEGSR
jgi:mono/diheme cytochrome c family protein